MEATIEVTGLCKRFGQTVALDQLSFTVAPGQVTGFVGPPDRQIRVIGEVAQPSALPYRAQLSILDVMIAVKGLTKFAAGNRAVIVRQEPEGARSYNVRLDDLLKDGDVTQNVSLQPGDILFVPQSWF